MFARHADDHRAPVGAAGPRRPDRRRRLRHRLLVARLPAPVPGRHPEDRARVHRARGGRPRRLGVRQRDRRARPDARPADHRRGDRGARPARAPARDGLRVRPGLPVREGRCRARRWPTRLAATGASRRVPAGANRRRCRRCRRCSRAVQPARLMFMLYAVVIGLALGSSSAAGRPASPPSGSAGRRPSSAACSSRWSCSRPGRGPGRRPRPADLRRLDAAGRGRRAAQPARSRACRSSRPARRATWWRSSPTAARCRPARPRSP